MIPREDDDTRDIAPPSRKRLLSPPLRVVAQNSRAALARGALSGPSEYKASMVRALGQMIDKVTALAVHDTEQRLHKAQLELRTVKEENARLRRERMKAGR